MSKSSVTACLLTNKPDIEPRQLYYNCDYYEFQANAGGIKALLDFKPTVAVMEPTGVNYSRLWGTHLARAGVEVRLVGHKELRRYREQHLDLPDKDDDADALALACYFFEYKDYPRRFVQIRDSVTVRVRELVLRLSHLNRVQSPIINRLRQDLTWQFPEVADVRSIRSQSSDTPLLWGWLAGLRTSSRYERLYEQSVGLGLTDTARLHAARLCDLQHEEAVIEKELRQLLVLPQFDLYREVFHNFGFGDRLTAVLVSQIHPFDAFLVDGKPEVVVSRGRKSGKPTTKYLSLRRFQKSLGMAPTEESSGKKKKKKVVGGSDLCKKAFWQWVFSRIEPKKSRLDNEIGKLLGEYLDAEKSSGRPVQLARSRTAVRACKLLFAELVKAIAKK